MPLGKQWVGMGQGNLDLMIELAVACLASEDHQKIKSTVRVMARRWPNEPALAIAFALTSAAASYEDVLDSDESSKIGRIAYRLAALVAADAYAIESMGQSPAKGQDLQHFWRRVDPYFLDI